MIYDHIYRHMLLYAFNINVVNLFADSFIVFLTTLNLFFVTKKVETTQIQAQRKIFKRQNLIESRNYRSPSRNKTKIKFQLKIKYHIDILNNSHQSINVVTLEYFLISLAMQFLPSYTFVMGLIIPSGSTAIAKLISPPAYKFDYYKAE